MVFRLIVSEAPDLTTIQVVGRLGDDSVAILINACGQARRPLVLDLSELTSASNASVLVLARLRGEGVHLLGVSHYVRLLLDRVADPPNPPAPRRQRVPRSQPPAADRAG